METSRPLVGRGVRAAAAGVLLSMIVAAWALVAQRGWSASALQEFLEAWPVLAPALFILLHCLAAAAFLPCSPFTLAAGFLWGTALGLPISIAGAFAASCFTFLVARYLAGAEWRARITTSAPGRLLAHLAAFGWKGVAVAQLNPVLPASTLGYIFGLTPLGFRVYAGAALLAMLPLQLALVALGGSLRGALLQDGAALGALALALGAAMLYLLVRWIAARRQAAEP